MASVSEYVEGELVFSRTGCAGIVMHTVHVSREHIDYIVMWTIEKDGHWKFNEQLRTKESITRG